MRKEKRAARGLAAGALAAALTSAAHAERAGVAEDVQNAAFQARETVGQAMAEDDLVYQQARVYTKQYGSLDIRLDDASRLRIAPNSSIVIDEYVFRPGGAPSVTLNLAKGALKMISGRLPSESYRVDNSVATIGVRGTEFWLNLAAGDRLEIWVLDGTVTSSPVRSDEVFVFDAPAYAVCSTTTCETGAAPPVPASYPTDPSSSGTDQEGPGDDVGSEQSEGP